MSQKMFFFLFSITASFEMKISYFFNRQKMHCEILKHFHPSKLFRLR